MSASAVPSTEIRSIASLRPNPLNPRGELHSAGIEELADSIRAQGVLQPLLVTPAGVVVAGHRRFAAARVAGLSEVPVIVRDLDRVQQQEIMLIQNLQRQELSAVEEARAYRRLLDGGHTTAQLARHIGVPSSRISARLVLLKLDEQVHWMFHRGDLPCLRGSKCVYVDPADLVVVQEIDWHYPPAELEEAALRGWRARLVKVLAGQDWRTGRPFRAEPLVRTDRRWGPRLIHPGPKPIEINAGDWVEVVAPVARRPYCLGRQGRVHLVFWFIWT